MYLAQATTTSDIDVNFSEHDNVELNLPMFQPLMIQKSFFTITLVSSIIDLLYTRLCRMLSIRYSIIVQICENYVQQAIKHGFQVILFNGYIQAIKMKQECLNKGQRQTQIKSNQQIKLLNNLMLVIEILESKLVENFSSI